MEISLVTNCMKVIKKAREINDKYGEVTAHLNAVAKKVKDNGLKVQDKTLLEKLIKIHLIL